MDKSVRAKQIAWEILDRIGCVAIGVEVRESINNIIEEVCRHEQIFLGEKIARRIYEKQQNRDFDRTSFNCEFETMLRAFSENSQLKALSPPDLINAITLSKKILGDLEIDLLHKAQIGQLAEEVEFAMKLAPLSGVELSEAIADCLHHAGIIDKFQRKYFALIYEQTLLTYIPKGCAKAETVEMILVDG